MYQRFVGLLVASTLISGVMTVLAWYKRDEPGGKPLAVFNLALFVGSAAYAADISATSAVVQRTWARVWLVAQAGTAMAWLFVAIEYAGYRKWATRRVVALLVLEPVALAVLLVVPTTDELVVDWPVGGTAGSIVQSGNASGTPLFFAHSLAILVVSLAGSIVFVQLFVRSRHMYRTQAAAVLLAALVPWVTVLTQVLLVQFSEDPSIFAWVVSGVALTAGLYRFKPLDTVPAAHESIVEEMGDGAIVIDNDGRISYANPAARSHLSGEAVVVGRDMAQVLDGWEELGHEDGEWQDLSLSVDGDQRFLELQVTPFTDRFDRVVGRLVVIRNVTERERRTRRLAQYKTIFESISQPVFVVDSDGRLLTVNDPFSQLVGYDEETLLGSPFERVLAPGEEVPAIADGASAEVTIEPAFGERVPCETVLAEVFLDRHDSQAVGVIRDISRRKEIESELALTTERFETLVESSPLAIVATDIRGHVEAWNPAAEEVFGWAPEEVVGEPSPILPDGQREDIRAHHRRVLEGERLTGVETTLERKDGSSLEVSVSMAPVHDSSGAVTGSVSVIVDISERKERERELRRTNERLDEFASIVSHDLRNPLGVAAGNLELAATADDEAMRAETLGSARDALERMERIIDDTLTLAREGGDIETTEPVPLAEVVDRAWENTVTEGADLGVGDLPAIVCDESRLTRLLENLFANAIEHGPAEGSAGDLTVTVGALDEGFFVADDGSGIPAGERESVLESGYSTSESGTGFGLSIVESIADAHGWTVTVTESESGGARFEVGGVSVVETPDPS